jgi:Ca-activated chloride channel family protein
MNRFWIILILALSVVPAVRADKAARLFEQGKFDEALKWYQKTAEAEPDNWPLQYNLGAAAYKAGRPDEAAKAFEKALASPDHELQAKAHYNMGNAYYRLGEAAEQQGPQQALPYFEKSLGSYKNALTMTPDDQDASYNRDLVEKKIEELKKQQEQQQQQQQQNQDKQDNKDQKDKKQQDQENQQNQNQQQQQANQNQNPKQNPQKPEPKQEEKQPDQAAQHDQQKKDEQAKQQPQPSSAQAGQTNNFDKMQASILLDNLRENEKTWNFFPEAQMKDLKDAGPPAKDW